MNYRHHYHAGNFADVFKHIVLISLIEALHKKEKPFCYLDTHAGIGYYDLMSEAPQKTQEFMSGIGKLWNISTVDLSPLLGVYLQAVLVFNQRLGAANLEYYPGSPCIVRELLRSDDRMILTELHSEDVALLKRVFARDKQVAVHHLDGYQALKAFLPPREGRGLVFIDPPFEQPDECTRLTQQLSLAARRWPGGIYAAWYPLKDRQTVNSFYRTLRTSELRDVVCCEFSVAAGSIGLNACGILVVNPPWQWQQALEKNLACLCRLLDRAGICNYRFEPIVAA